MKGRRNKLGKRVYFKHGAWYYVDYQRKWHRLGKTEAEAYQALSTLFVAGDKTMSAVFNRYEIETMPELRKRGELADATVQMRKGHLKNLRRSFGMLIPARIRPKDIAAYHDARAGQSLIQSNRELSTLSVVFDFAIRWGYLDRNPCENIRKHREHPRDRYVEDWEVTKVIRHARQRYPYIPRIMAMMLITGQDKRSVILLERHQIKKDGIEFRRHKTGKRILVEWTPTMRRIVKEALREHQKVKNIRVFLNARGSPLTLTGFESAWGKVMRKLVERGVLEQPFRPHDLRAKNYSDQDNWRLLGHSARATADRHYKRTAWRVRADDVSRF